MIQKLIGERSVLSMSISIALAFVLMFLLPQTHQDFKPHWLFSSGVSYPAISRILSLCVLIGMALLHRDVQGRMKLSQQRGYFQPLFVALFVIPISIDLSFIQIASIGASGLGMLMLISTHRTPKPETTLQHVGLASGTAILLHPPMIWCLLVCALMAIRLRQRTWRMGIIYLLGAMFPFVILFTFLLAINCHEGKLMLLFNHFVPIVGLPINYYGWIPVLAIIGYIFYKPFGDGYAFGLIPIREMELLQTHAIWAGSFIVLGFTGMIAWPVAFWAAAIPLSALVSISMENSSKWWVPDLVVVILLAALLLP